MSGAEKKAPGAGTGTGGKGENEDHNPNIIPESIADAPTGTDQKDLLPDTGASVAFMRNFCGDGPRVLTSIVPDGGRTTTATFAASEDDKMVAWIDERQGVQNIYFTVNAVFGPVTSKPNKGAVSAVRALHVDVDPRPGEDFDTERVRAERVLRAYGCFVATASRVEAARHVH